MIKPISYKGKTFGYIIKYTRKLGVNFFTPKKLSHQVGFIKHKSKHLIKPHKHFKNVRRVEYTSEVLIILKGKLRVDFYSDTEKYLFISLKSKFILVNINLFIKIFFGLLNDNI